MGFGGSLCIVMIQAILSDLYGERRIIALTESNIAASASASLAPLAVGGFQRVGIGWRSALFLAMVMLALISVRFHDAPVPDARQSSVRPGSTGHRALPRSFWAYWVVVYLVVSIEWGLIVWGADFLANVVGLSKTDASTTMSVFLMAMLAGRILGSRLARMMPGTAILLMALGVSLVGFPIFWLARLAFLNVAGLFIAGLGVANLFPLTMSTAVGTAPQQSNVASARVSLGTGMAILSAPLILGWIADQVSLQNAYGMVALLLMMAIAIVFFAGRTTGSQGVSSCP
jgi:fucose permease